MFYLILNAQIADSHPHSNPKHRGATLTGPISILEFMHSTRRGLIFAELQNITSFLLENLIGLQLHLKFYFLFQWIYLENILAAPSQGALVRNMRFYYKSIFLGVNRVHKVRDFR